MEAIVRPAGWEFPLFLHVGGAMLLVGSLVAVLAVTAASVRAGDGGAALTRLSFRLLLFAAVPAFVVMRVGAEWIYSKENFGDSDPSWVGIGYAASDGGLLLIVIATVLAWRFNRRAATAGGRGGTVVVVLSTILLVAFTVTIWAMTTKPG